MALKGIKVIELAGLAPAPFCGMILSDFGANVIKIDKPGLKFASDTMMRGKRSITINLRKQQGAELFKKLCRSADVLIEPYRAETMEKLKLDPSVLCEENPRLIYARLTGFGQHGPYSKMAGHDINYIATSGILSRFGPRGEKPSFPINLLADFAGGGLMCALGICMALLERVRSGKGQIIDANMVEGSAYVGSWLWTSLNIDSLPLWSNERGRNILDGGAPFYQTYKTKDGKYMAVGALEPQFYDQLLKGLELDPNVHPQTRDWEELEKTFTDIFASKTQEEWCKMFDFKDACVTPVVQLEEAHAHKHNEARKSFQKCEHYYVPQPAPHLSRTPGHVSTGKVKGGGHAIEILKEEGYSDSGIERLVSDGAVEIKQKSSL